MIDIINNPKVKKHITAKGLVGTLYSINIPKDRRFIIGTNGESIPEFPNYHHITVKVYEEITITAVVWTSNNIAWRNGIPYEVSYV